MSRLIGVMKNGENQEIPIEELNVSNVKNIIHKNDNPHPVLITVIAFVLVMLIYYIYVVFIKVNFGGKWFIEEKEQKSVIIHHNLWSDGVTIDNIGTGYIKGGAIYVSNGKMGVLYNNNIYWTDKTVWKRPIDV